MRPSGTHLYERVHPSVCPSIRVRCASVPRLYLATARSCSEINDRRTSFESVFCYSVISFDYLSICLSIYVTCLAPNSVYTEKQPRRIVARSGLLKSVRTSISILRDISDRMTYRPPMSAPILYSLSVPSIPSHLCPKSLIHRHRYNFLGKPRAREIFYVLFCSLFRPHFWPKGISRVS